MCIDIKNSNKIAFIGRSRKKNIDGDMIDPVQWFIGLVAVVFYFLFIF